MTYAGRPARIGIAEDVNDRVRAANALRASEERFRRITETIAEVFWMADVNLAQILYVSPAYEHIWGRSCESLQLDPRSFIDAIHPEDRERVLDALKVQRTGQPFDHEYRIVRPDGEVRWISDRGFPVPNAGGPAVQYVGAARDITERRRAGERVRLLVRAIESTNEMVSVTDLDDRFTFVNRAFLRTYGYAAEEVIGQTPALLRSPDTPDAVIDEILTETRRGEWHGELRNRRKDGSQLTIRLDTSLIRDPEERVIGLLGVARDITDRVRAEEALRDAEERMRFALEASEVGVWDADLRSGACYWSETCEVMHGVEPGTFGKRFDAFIERIHVEDRQQVLQTIEQGTREHQDVELEYRTSWPDGTERRISTTAHFFYDEAGAAVRGAGVSIDVTERRSLEDQLRQSQKMEAVGQLAGGIAHDFNNMLTAILGNAEFVSDDLAEDDVHRQDIEEITKAARRAAALTHQLLAFSRKQMLTPRVLHLGDVVSDVTPMLRRLLGEHIDLMATIGDRGRVRADAGQMEQVLVNLAVNARDAMPQGGRLTIETADISLDDAYARQHPTMRPGPHVMIAVSDTGHGMDAGTQQRVFEPFFTTKPKGEGTGLGLATVYGIVKQSGGHIWVYSEVGRGTTFKVYLPRTDDIEAALQPLQTDRHALRGSETVLLVEDEAVVRGFADKVLSRYGYVVRAVADPKGAIEYCDGHDGAIDLILTDVVLPDMSGRALAAVLQERHPESRVLYTSGYTDNAVVRQGVLDSDMWFLQKPFTAEALVTRVRQALDA